ncbi:MAG TPA: 4'-phosphopantetheinyl transferase superfamily protein [Anaerolineales bacterium]|jgi:4'-phosphopantetheinyl transferase|nr:4'-phosphopantetheinyl transferase superfamily protein [Anaerolineales bacterium]HQX15741.1 4'-phosphopantetheinyl transferase superfamily protein [Anaerolineales bacterium]
MQRNDPELQSSQVDVWRVRLDVKPDSIQQLRATLSVDEIARASRFHFDKDQHSYIVAHASLRDVLSRYLQFETHHLKFSVNQYGKPFLPEHDIEFNLSHAGDFALIAVTRERQVGVDVELVRTDIEIESLASRFFSSSELSELMALSPEQRVLGFFNCWTRKEAYIKARGLGLSLPLESFDVSLASDESTILRATRPEASEVHRWTLFSLDVHPDYTGALAAEGVGLVIRYWDWNFADG